MKLIWQTARRSHAAMRLGLSSMLTAVLLAGCDAGRPSSSLVDRFGSFPTPNPSRRLVVTRREKSLVDFKVVDTVTGKQLIADYIGSDAMRWFLYWETPSRLWGYGSDIGYFKVFDFHPDGTVSETQVKATLKIPRMVWNNLPSSLQRDYNVEPSSEPNRR